MSILVDLEYREREREERLIVCDHETHQRCYGGLARGEHWAVASVLPQGRSNSEAREKERVLR